jgi:hypothetical protein
MPLTGQQITHLAQVFHEQWDLPRLIEFAVGLDFNLNNEAPSGSLKERAIKFINKMNCSLPPRDRELLEQLRLHGNATLKAVASEMLAPTFYSPPPTNDPHHAILLGRAAFVDRADLRQIITEFTNPTPFTTRILIIRGDQPGGKSYSWEYLRHLAVSSVGATPQRLRLENKGYTPRQLLEQVGLLLGLKTSAMPQMIDDPQLARIDPLINWFKGKLPTLKQAHWLVIDDLNAESVTPAMRETAYAIAYSAEEIKNNLWVALLGYNTPITDPDLRFIAREDAQFPDAKLVAQHFECIARGSPMSLTLKRAEEIANLLFSKFPTIDKGSMIELTPMIEKMGEKLMVGQQP